MFKKNTIKKHISTLLTLALIISSLAVGMIAFGDDLVAINETNFPDKNWRKIVSVIYDKNGDGFLSSTERNKTFMSLSGYLESVCDEDEYIESLQGIEFFSNVQRLYVGSLGLKTLDVSSLTNLTQLTCQGNMLTSLRIGTKQSLTWINCASNELKSINVAGCPQLERLDCYANKLENLDVTANSRLSELYCQDNALKSLDLSSNSLLTTVYCSNNHLTELDLSENRMLSEVTQYMIGYQTVSAKAQLSGSSIVVPFKLNRSQVASTSLDTVVEGESENGESKVNLGYSTTGNFVTKDANELKLEGFDGDTIEYEYNVNNPAAENMSVFISVSRDFYQVRFYTDETMTELMRSQFVTAGANANAPEITDFPEGKIFGGWSKDITNVSSDIDTYIKWINNHIWTVTKANDGEITIHCYDCDAESTFMFTDVLNIVDEDMYYLAELDVVSDGVINAKDYAKLHNQLKK